MKFKGAKCSLKFLIDEDEPAPHYLSRSHLIFQRLNS